MRKGVTATMVGVGVVLMIVSYFFWAAPWGAHSVVNSNPRFSYAPALFVVGVLMVFSSAIFYEVFRDRKN